MKPFVEYTSVFVIPFPPATHSGGGGADVVTVPVTAVPFCTPLPLTAYTLNVYGVLDDKPVYGRDVVFAPEMVAPDAGVPPVGLYVMINELYAPEHDNVVPVAFVDPNVTVDVTTPSVYKLPAVPPVTVNGVPATPAAS